MSCYVERFGGSILLKSIGRAASTFGHVGTVEEVIAANISKKVSSKRMHAADYFMGFELATPKELSSLGEAVIVNGSCYTTSTDRQSPEYNQMIFGESFIPGGVFLFPKGIQPNHQVEIESPIEMLQFYQDLYPKIGKPFAFAALFQFSQFHGTAIGKAPIDGRNIFTHKDEYYPNPDIHAENVFVFVIGVISDFQGDSKLNRELKSVLYKNPMDQSSDLIHHAHCLLLNKKINRFEEIHPKVVQKSLHLFVEGSEISSGRADIFTIAAVQNYGENL